jgi:hypothetical protein
MHFVVGRPAIDEQPQANAGAEPDHEEEAVLRLRHQYTVGLHARSLYARVQFREDGDPEDQCNAQAQIHQPR